MKGKKVLAALLAGVLCLSATSLSYAAEAGTATQEKKVTLFLTRHGKTMLNTTGRMQGWCDSPLTPDGVKVAENPKNPGGLLRGI